jgi:hypothetical protein
MHSWSHRKPDPADAERTGEPSPRVALSATVGPVLELQATVGNAAVTSLLRGPGGAGPSVQRLWDTDEDEDVPSDEGPSDQGPAEDGGGGGAAPDEAPEDQPSEETGDPFAAVESEVSETLDPGTVVDTLAPYETPDEELGDFEVPDNGTTAQALRIQRDNTPEEPKPTREGKPGDIIKAFKPYLEPALKWLEENVLDALRKIKAGEAVVTVIVAAPIIIGPLTQPGPRKLALDQLDGTDVTFGLIPHLQIKPQITDGQLRGGTVTYDLAPALRKAGIPF